MGYVFSLLFPWVRLPVWGTSHSTGTNDTHRRHTYLYMDWQGR
jgi:hypothetical protein